MRRSCIRNWRQNTKGKTQGTTVREDMPSGILAKLFFCVKFKEVKASFGQPVLKKMHQ